MKLSHLAIGLLLSPLWLAAEPVVTAIREVTVYGDRAVVTREGAAQVSAGVNELVFDRLPAGLRPESVQIAARGVPATLLDVNTRSIYLEAEPNPRIQQLETELETLRNRDRVLADEARVLDQQRVLLDRITSAATAPAGKDAPAPTAESWSQILAFQAETLGKLNASQQKLADARTALANQIAAVEHQLADLHSSRSSGRSVQTVTVRLSAEKAGRLDVTLSYATPGAAWAPAYDVRLTSADRTVKLDYFGVVRNATGEDWNNVALTLSTARPNLGGAAPDASPWILDVYRPVVMSAPRSFAMAAAAPAPAMRERLEQKSADKAVDEVVDSGFAAAVVDQNATSATFKLAAPVTVASNNTQQKVPVGSYTLPAVLSYKSTPRLLAGAFLSAAVTNASDTPLLAGSANTFLDGTFVAAARLDTVMPGEKFDLALGADDSIAVTHKLVKRFAEDTGFTSKYRRTSYEYLITVTNHKTSRETIEIADALPVSRDEKIVVRIAAPAEKDPAATRDDQGVYTWKLDLAPGQTREIPVKFTVEHPADVSVSGME